MLDRGRTAARYAALRSSGEALLRLAPVVRFGVFGIGLTLFLDQVRPLLTDTQFTWGERRVMGIVALFTLGGFGLGSWILTRLLKAGAEAIGLMVDAAEAGWRTADLIELQVVPALGRIANALERSGTSQRESSTKALEQIRRATTEGRWEHAVRLAGQFARDFPESPDANLIEREIAEARWAVVDQLQAQLEQARRRDDAVAVLDTRDTLTLHLRGDALHDLDRQLTRWVIGHLQRKVRESTPVIELLDLTTRATETFPDTNEATALAELLAKLRKAAGRCIRCGRVNSNKNDVCPACRSQEVPLNSASTTHSREKS
ncbi:hypothetical protein [Singulisphaera sp. PoT]|uniref:hypothetical protein n=1 Tax=Singulisphaera sp. PoT TaxID=3411797 RepID=UPI003BF4F626